MESLSTIDFTVDRLFLSISPSQHPRSQHGRNGNHQAAANAADGDGDELRCKGLAIDQSSEIILVHVLDHQGQVFRNIDIENRMNGCVQNRPAGGKSGG